MIASILVSIGLLSIVSCPPIALVFGILEGTHAAVTVCVTMIGAATICIVGGCVEINRKPPETV